MNIWNLLDMNLIIILILSFLIYPYVEKKVFNYKDLDYLLVRLNKNTPLPFNSMSFGPVLQSLEILNFFKI